jgi:hypothetical protein
MKGRRLISGLFLLPNYRQNFLICSHNLYYTSLYQKSILEIKEHTFYNNGIAILERACQRGSCMDYKEETLKLKREYIKKIDEILDILPMIECKNLLEYIETVYFS